MQTIRWAETLAQVVGFAQEAAHAAMKHYGPNLVVDSKGGDPTNMVTQADRDANAVLLGRLGAAFPHDGLLAEESEGSHGYAGRQHHQRLWCIDPIDGTREFVAGSGQFSVMVGLAVDGVARLGVVLQPVHKTVWAGYLDDDGVGHGYVQRGDGPEEALGVTPTTNPAAARMMVSRTWHSKGIEAVAHKLGVTNLQPQGSVGLKMAHIAQGRAEIYISPSRKTHEWDACGPEAILRAAGGTVTDILGKPLRYNKPNTCLAHGILASNGPLHAATLGAILHVAEQMGRSDIARVAGDIPPASP